SLQQFHLIFIERFGRLLSERKSPSVGGSLPEPRWYVAGKSPASGTLLGLNASGNLDISSKCFAIPEISNSPSVQHPASSWLKTSVCSGICASFLTKNASQYFVEIGV